MQQHLAHFETLKISFSYNAEERTRNIFQYIIGSYITDFACLDRMLVIEVDGLIHQLPENKESDEVRTNWLYEQGKDDDVLILSPGCASF